MKFTIFCEECSRSYSASRAPKRPKVRCPAGHVVSLPVLKDGTVANNSLAPPSFASEAFIAELPTTPAPLIDVQPVVEVCDDGKDNAADSRPKSIVCVTTLRVFLILAHCIFIALGCSMDDDSRLEFAKEQVLNHAPTYARSSTVLEYVESHKAELISRTKREVESMITNSAMQAFVSIGFGLIVWYRPPFVYRWLFVLSIIWVPIVILMSTAFVFAGTDLLSQHWLSVWLISLFVFGLIFDIVQGCVFLTSGARSYFRLGIDNKATTPKTVAALLILTGLAIIFLGVIVLLVTPSQTPLMSARSLLIALSVIAFGILSLWSGLVCFLPKLPAIIERRVICLVARKEPA